MSQARSPPEAKLCRQRLCCFRHAWISDCAVLVKQEYIRDTLFGLA
jgi:hypothetical protein